MENGVRAQVLSNMDTLIAQVDNEAKRAYMQRIWAMDKEQIFHELMRVHGESAKLLQEVGARVLILEGIIKDLEESATRH